MKMKNKSLFIALLAITLTSCWESLPDGRQFKIERTCVRGHHETQPQWQPIMIGKMMSGYWVNQDVWVCDETRDDTVWNPHQIQK